MSIFSREMIKTFAVLLLVGFIMVVGINIGYKTNIIILFKGVLILTVISVVGYILAKVIPIKFPAVGWVAIIGIVLSIPDFLPINNMILKSVEDIPFIATATPALAFAGIAVGKDWEAFKKIGWKGIVVSLLVLTGTLVGSALMAEFILRALGKI
ncbi:DUF340 domain-containing protein [Tissierella praeacuta]|uniref:DUF340 domain-containing protein n=1 Tax=Tissierella praeacuta TaxID=43131 RepID=UPI0035137A50